MGENEATQLSMFALLDTFSFGLICDSGDYKASLCLPFDLLIVCDNSGTKKRNEGRDA